MPKRPRGDRGVIGRYRVTAFSARLNEIQRERDRAILTDDGERADKLSRKIAVLERRRDTFRSFTPLPDG